MVEFYYRVRIIMESVKTRPGLAQLCDTVESVAQLALDGTEFTCLKALVLFNPHVAGLGGGEQVGVASADLWSPVP